MLQGLAKAKALKEFKALRQDKASLKGLALAKGLKRLRELRADLGMGKKQDEQKVYVDTLVFNLNQQVLLVQRHANDDFMPNKWWIAGGKLEQGETLEQGAKRELLEETGIKLSDVSFVEKAKLQNGDISHRFTGVVDNDTPIHLQKDELQAYRWVNVDELSKFDLLGKLSDLQDLVELASEIVGFDGDVERDDKSVLNDDEIERLSQIEIDDTHDMGQGQRKGVAKKWIRDNLLGKTVRTVDGKIVHFNSEDTVNHIPFNVRRNAILAMTIPFIPVIFAKGEFAGREVSEPEHQAQRTDQSIQAFHLYQKWVELKNGYKVYAQVQACERENEKELFYAGYNLKALDKIRAVSPSHHNDNSVSTKTTNAQATTAHTMYDKAILDEKQVDIDVEQVLPLRILQVLDENGKDITDEVLSDGWDGNDKTNDLPTTAYQLHEKPTANNRQKDNDRAVALMRELQASGRKATAEEKAILSRYTGTGGNLVGEDGLQGSDYEYYTPIEVAGSMWDLLKQSGFNGGMVLDPSAGTGIFKASAPKDENILMHSVELSEISGKINALINDDDRHSVTISPFEQVASSTEDETMDAIMTNVPFGDTSARGANRFLDNKFQDDTLEEYFIKRSLDKLKPNGLAMFIVPTKMLDGKNYAKFRQAVLLRADLLGAYRLPNKVFDATGADVTTDIIVLKKFSQDAKDKIDNLFENGGLKTLQQAKVLDKDIIAGQYFTVYGRAFVLGEYQTGKGRFGDVVRVVNDDSLANILKLVQKFPDSRIDYGLLEMTDFATEINFKNGDVRVLDGTTFEYSDGVWQKSTQQQMFNETPFVNFLSLIEHGVKKSNIDEYQGYLASVGRKMPEWLYALHNGAKNDNELYYWAVLNAVFEALKVEKDDGYEPHYPTLTKAMNNIFPDYQANRIKSKNPSYKGLHKAVSIAFNVVGVSDYWKTGQGVQFDSVVLNHQQAYENAVYNGKAENFAVDVDLIKQSNPDFNPLTDDDFCINADGSKVTLARDYYSGNYGEFLAKIDAEIEQATEPKIKEKLLKQKAHAESLIDYTDVKKLQFSLLSTIIPFDMKFRYFNEFVDSQVIVSSKGEKDKLDFDNAVKVTNKDLTESMINGDYNNHTDLRRYLLNRIFISIGGQVLKIDDKGLEPEVVEILNAKLQRYFAELNLSFEAWLKAQKDYMAELDYQFNAPSNKEFPSIADGTPFEIANFKPKYENFKSLHDYQFEEVRRLSRSFGGICGFDVGLGKTATALATIQNLHNIGVKQRTMIVVPNHTISKWAKDIRNVYDDVSDVLVVGTKQNQNDNADSKFYADDLALLTTEQGKQYRKILLTVEAVGNIPMREQYIVDYFGDDSQGAEEWAEMISNRRSDKERKDGAIASIINKLNKYESKLPYFEDMGVDSIVFDEAQVFKNGMQSGEDFNRIGGLAGKALKDLAQRALSARLKSWFVRGRNKQNHGTDDGVVLLTATPFTNSPIEIMTMLSLAIGDEKLKKIMGGTAVRNANDFLSLFAQIESVTQKDILGRLVNKDMFTGFTNVDLLKKVVHQVANIQNAKDRGLKIPNEHHETSRVQLPDSDMQQLEKMKLYYRIAKVISKGDKASESDKVFVKTLPQEIMQEYEMYKEQLKEEDSTIGHAFSLINRMSEVALLGSEMALERNFKLSFDEKQSELAEKIAKEFNTAKRPSPVFTTTRNYPLSDKYVTEKIKENEETGEIKVEYTVKAEVVVYADNLVLNVDDATMISNLMALVDKHGLNVRPKLSAKVQALMENVKLELSQPKHQGFAKQLIFCDTLSMHHVIKRALISECGIPSSQIAILNAQTLPDGKAGNPDTEDVQAIQDLFADNHYTIVIANKKAETGIDLQKGTQAIHHLTTGWTPDSLQQRNGRGVRQGNTQDVVTIYAYNAEGTFDEYKKTLIDNKADWIEQVMDKGMEIGKSITVSQALSEQDYEDLINADSSEKIAELVKAKAEREAQAKAERVQAKNTFIFNEMKKARDNAKRVEFSQVLNENMTQTLNAIIDLLASKAGGQEQVEKRHKKAWELFDKNFAGLPSDVKKIMVYELEERAMLRGNHRSKQPISQRGVKDIISIYGSYINELAVEKGVLDESKKGKWYGSLTTEEQQVIRTLHDELLQSLFGENVDTPLHHKVRSIVSSRIELEQTTKEAFLNNDDSEFDRDERQAIVDGVAVVKDGELLYDLDIVKFSVSEKVYYAIAKVERGIVKYHTTDGFWGIDNYQKIDISERANAIEYMVNVDFEKAKENNMTMDDKLVYSQLLTEVYNLVQTKINEGLEDYMSQTIEIRTDRIVHKDSGRAYGDMNYWNAFIDDDVLAQVKQQYYAPMANFIEMNDDSSYLGKISRANLELFKKDFVYSSTFYELHLRPFLVANSLKLNFIPNFKENGNMEYLMKERILLTYQVNNILGVENTKNGYTPIQQYDEYIKVLAYHCYGDIMANIDDFLGTEDSVIKLFTPKVVDMIKSVLGERSDGDPKLAKRHSMLDKAKALAKPNKNDVLMVALKADGYGNVLFKNKERLKKIIKTYEWNNGQSAWYVDLESLPALMDTSWFDFDEISVHEPEKYA